MRSYNHLYLILSIYRIDLVLLLLLLIFYNILLFYVTADRDARRSDDSNKYEGVQQQYIIKYQ